MHRHSTAQRGRARRTQRRTAGAAACVLPWLRPHPPSTPTTHPLTPPPLCLAPRRHAAAPRRRPELPGVPFAALTATATPAMRDSIVASLRLGMGPGPGPGPGLGDGAHLEPHAGPGGQDLGQEQGHGRGQGPTSQHHGQGQGPGGQEQGQGRGLVRLDELAAEPRSNLSLAVVHDPGGDGA